MVKPKLPKVRPFAQIRKAAINVVGLASVVIDAFTPILHGAARVDAGVAIAVATAIVHYRVPNDRAPASADTTAQGAES